MLEEPILMQFQSQAEAEAVVAIIAAARMEHQHAVLIQQSAVASSPDLPHHQKAQVFYYEELHKACETLLNVLYPKEDKENPV